MSVYPYVIVAFFCFVVGYGINHLFMSVVASAVSTIFVFGSEGPKGWQLIHPQHYKTLHETWIKILSDEYNNGYGKHADANVDGRV
ncbi:hypothetical protein KXD40_003438 [Peronospora effusa]|uniref:Uncharacterized protein n=1 Tax=Peronospora effusa TaxID=542832 RepID=A0A3M6VQ08_9STRA|nr:hypothetical protein DD238_006515 [Peronospora effusa]RQM13439.1 hypothetical protein DD237_006767 [Peronospora effusa]UIZ22889.1 hypothetical protein KXD40_003438 [Peronospora effusa]